MALISRMAVIVAALLAGTSAWSAEREMTISREVFACTSWAGWHEYGLASLTARGARMNRHCPIRIAAKTKVVVVDEDAGEGASEIRYQGKSWFVDSQQLN